MKQLVKVISVDPELCVNCHACIAACPVKYCNDATGDHVEVKADLCIGCGHCLEACTHGARRGLDDFDRWLSDIRSGTRMIAISAPSIAANFPGDYLRIHGWLRSLGVAAFFDVSFGAELTIRSYADHIQGEKPATVIAQPCPAVVSYIQLYQSELLRYLAPAHSPMLHTIKMIREHFPKFADSRVVVLSPCYAKKREFDEAGLGDYNVTFASIAAHLEKNGIELSSYPEVGFEGDPAERAVLFSSPGGLRRTLERDNPAAAGKTRKIEGPDILYDYLKKLPGMIDRGHAPLLVDCLNCDMGCNGGPGTLNVRKSPDEIEAHIERRNEEMREVYRKQGLGSSPRAAEKRVRRAVSKYWRRGLYERGYLDLSGNNTIRKPTEGEFASIYSRMHKRTERDFLNCGACGYGSCEAMAIAIHNGLNKASNCFHYEQLSRVEMTEMLFGRIRESTRRLSETLGSITDTSAAREGQDIVSSREIAEISHEMRALIQTGMEFIESSLGNMDEIRSSSRSTGEEMDILSEKVRDISEIAGMISGIADQTKIIAFNAELEASAAGETGRSFEIVASEIRRLASGTAASTSRIKEIIEGIQVATKSLHASSLRENRSVEAGSDLAGKLRDVFKTMTEYSIESDRKIDSSMETQVRTINQTLEELDRIVLDLDRFGKM